MALAASCKWVGLFTVAGVGIFTVVDLWNLLGDRSVSLRTLGRHVMARVVTLIVVPILIYIACFWVHLHLLTKYSPAASGYSLGFQQGLEGAMLPSTDKPVYYGATVRLKQLRTEGPFLHSHQHFYPAGSKQQQVTGYHHRDHNNLWILRRPYTANVTFTEGDVPDERETQQPLLHGDYIRLEHVPTKRYLHSHPVDPPVSNKEHHFEVSAYGHSEEGYGDTNDNWQILLVDGEGNTLPVNEQTVQLEAINHNFRLVHQNLRCGLHGRGKALPEWAYKQNEITCGRDTLRTNMIWLFEHNKHPLSEPGVTPQAEFVELGFFGRVIELNKRMWQSNAHLSADHPYGSRPQDWPFLRRGIGFWNGNHVPKPESYQKRFKEAKLGQLQIPDPLPEGWILNTEFDHENRKSVQVPMDPAEQAEYARLQQVYRTFKGQQVHLIGNPLFWWFTSGCLVAYVAVLFVYRLGRRRSPGWVKALEESYFGSQLKLTSAAGFSFLMWLLHFVPFFGMRRQLFLHHYLPALFFSALLSGILLDGFISLIGSILAKRTNVSVDRVRTIILATLVLSMVWSYSRFAPLGYGTALSRRQCQAIKWRSNWDWDCGHGSGGEMQGTEAQPMIMPEQMEVVPQDEPEVDDGDVVYVEDDGDNYANVQQ